MSRVKHPIHPHGTYWIHGDGRPRQVRILEIGTGSKAGKVHVHDGRTRFWIAREHLKRNEKPARRPPQKPDLATALAWKRGAAARGHR